MLDLAIRGTLILVFAFAAAGVMRRASAAARHLLWASALTGLLVLPAVVRLGPAVQVPVPVPVLASTTALAPDAAPVVIAEAAPAAEPEVTVVRRELTLAFGRASMCIARRPPSRLPRTKRLRRLRTSLPRIGWSAGRAWGLGSAYGIPGGRYGRRACCSCSAACWSAWPASGRSCERQSR
jgi:hypothetical protein